MKPYMSQELHVCVCVCPQSNQDSTAASCLAQVLNWTPSDLYFPVPLSLFAGLASLQTIVQIIEKLKGLPILHHTNNLLHWM